jgi:hypothetical protein
MQCPDSQCPIEHGVPKGFTWSAPHNPAALHQAFQHSAIGSGQSLSFAHDGVIANGDMAQQSMKTSLFLPGTLHAGIPALLFRQPLRRGTLKLRAIGTGQSAGHDGVEHAS